MSAPPSGLCPNRWGPQASADKIGFQRFPAFGGFQGKALRNAATLNADRTLRDNAERSPAQKDYLLSGSAS
ncbi:hypothetical protein AA21952_2801 [Acetobacter oeni LMG 21952]|nr:hypothetical protein AA21952_2801 [Acetobacter oeni LMG 21952]